MKVCKQPGAWFQSCLDRLWSSEPSAAGGTIVAHGAPPIRNELTPTTIRRRERSEKPSPNQLSSKAPAERNHSALPAYPWGAPVQPELCNSGFHIRVTSRHQMVPGHHRATASGGEGRVGADEAQEALRHVLALAHRTADLTNPRPPFPPSLYRERR